MLATCRINIVILAEGYTAAQQGDFDLDAATTINTLLADPFYFSYGQFFNAYSILSPPTSPVPIIRKPALMLIPTSTAPLDSYGIDRLLTIPPNDIDSDYKHGEGKVFNLLANLLPQYDVVILLANDCKYGRSGRAG